MYYIYRLNVNGRDIFLTSLIVTLKTFKVFFSHGVINTLPLVKKIPQINVSYMYNVYQITGKTYRRIYF